MHLFTYYYFKPCQWTTAMISCNVAFQITSLFKPKFGSAIRCLLSRNIYAFLPRYSWFVPRDVVMLSIIGKVILLLIVEMCGRCCYCIISCASHPMPPMPPTPPWPLRRWRVEQEASDQRNELPVNKRALVLHGSQRHALFPSKMAKDAAVTFRPPCDSDVHASGRGGREERVKGMMSSEARWHDGVRLGWDVRRGEQSKNYGTKRTQ